MYYLVAVSLVFTVLLGVGLAFSTVSTLIWRIAGRQVENISSSARASILFYLRVLPLALAATVTLFFVLPAFLLYEPREPQETVSWKLAAVIVVALFGIAIAIFRIFASWWRTRRLIGMWQKYSAPLELDGVTTSTYRLRHDFPIFAIVGVLRPRLFVSERVLAALGENEVSAVLLHERGHIVSADNFKRLLVRLCGDILVAPVGRSLDRAWSEASESAADEFAVAIGGRRAALDLAEALIKIARIIPENAKTPSPLVSYVLWSGESLTDRIRRLLQLADNGVSGPVKRRWALLPTAAIITILVASASNHAVLAHIHVISESLLALLQ